MNIRGAVAERLTRSLCEPAAVLANRVRLAGLGPLKWAQGGLTHSPFSGRIVWTGRIAPSAPEMA
jgi:hypothetical protein